MELIKFEKVDGVLRSLGKDRRWLANKTGRALSSIRDALAPGARTMKRSKHLQWAIHNAILNEMELREAIRKAKS